MTPSNKPTVRLTPVLVRDRGLRQLVATLHGGLLILRPYGCRREEVLDLAAAYSIATKQRLVREKAERKAKKGDHA